MPHVAAAVAGFMPNLRFVQLYSAGLDGLLHPTMMVGTYGFNWHHHTQLPTVPSWRLARTILSGRHIARVPKKFAI
jgi:hypothetical protein